MKLLDTNVIAYARGRPGPYHQACVAILREAEADPNAYGIDVELLQELLDLYVRRGDRPRAATIVQDVLTLFPDPLPVSRREIEEAVAIVRRSRRLSPRDAIHAAVAITYDLEGIVSADRGFDRITGLTRLDPRELSQE